MDRRRLLLLLAVFVAVIGTALVFLYVKGADKRASDQYDNVSVLKATQDIAAGETYDAALSAGKMTLQPVPKNQVVEGAQTTTTDLAGKIAAIPVFTGQQIIASQFGNSLATTNSALAIPKGMIAISVNLTDPDRVAGNIQNGSEVAIFVTGQLETKPGAGGVSTSTEAEQSTRLLLPKVTVLNVGSPQPPTTSTKTDPTSGEQTTEQLPRTLLTLAVTQKEAQKVIVASKALDLTFGLLTSNSEVKPGPGTSTQVASLFK